MEQSRKRKHASPSARFDMDQVSENHMSQKARRLHHRLRNTSADPMPCLERDSRDPPRDWRQIICRVLSMPTTVKDEDLESALDAALDENTSRESSPSPIPFQDVDPYYQILHRVRCRAVSDALLVYSDEPFMHTNDDVNIGSHLSGRNRVSDINRYLDRNHGLSFVTIREYICCDVNNVSNPDGPLQPAHESIIFKSRELCAILNGFKDIVPNGHEIFGNFVHTEEYFGLYYRLFHHNDRLAQLPEIIQDRVSSKHLACFMEYLQHHKAAEFKKVDDMLEQGMITSSYFQYLLMPGDIYILSHPSGVDYSPGVQLVSCPKYAISWVGESHSSDRYSSHKPILMDIELEVSAWEFDGNFQRNTFTQSFRIPWEVNAPQPIPSLPVIPFKHAPEEMQRTLSWRGHMFWQCRTQKYVSYQDWGIMNEEHFNDSRFLIDSRTYKKSYHDKQAPRSDFPITQDFRDDLGKEAMDQDQPPTEEFALTVPTTLPGFNMHDKLWWTLLVARLRPITWDDKAFQSLVLPEDTKDVIRALVTHRVSSSSSTDIIRGKGNGLILLLHGPPGTGKTLTAESVAEHARKPLYRVTCGDIGTKPEAVERYLGNVLRLAKIWDCVVLLDEAEVFLQERSLTDLERNALVSVFLRVLEYYDGILMLTSNRVGTLDEGFRSRIQLALEYPKLNSNSRRRVWENFFERLGNDPVESADLDLPDLRRNLSNLSNYELNGREIRNAISVARPLALSNGAQVDFRCLQKVIGVQQRFLKYMKDMNEGLDDERVAREEGKR